MASRFKCVCGMAILVEGPYGGKRVKCPNCERILMVPIAVATNRDDIRPPAKLRDGAGSRLGSLAIRNLSIVIAAALTCFLIGLAGFVIGRVTGSTPAVASVSTNTQLLESPAEESRLQKELAIGKALRSKNPAAETRPNPLKTNEEPVSAATIGSATSKESKETSSTVVPDSTNRPNPRGNTTAVKKSTPKQVLGLTVTTRNGFQIDLTAPSVDYTNYPFVGFYTPDFESNGLRINYKGGTQTVPWENIELAQLRAPQRASVTGALTLRSGKSIEFEAVGDSGRGLKGRAELGYFAIRLRGIRRIETKFVDPSSPITRRARVSGVLLTMASGDEIEYTKPPIVAYDFPGNTSGIGGIVLRRGGGEHSLYWSSINSVKIDSSSPLRASVELVNGYRITAELKNDDSKGLYGKTELGVFGARLNKVKTIKVLRTPVVEK